MRGPTPRKLDVSRSRIWYSWCCFDERTTSGRRIFGVTQAWEEKKTTYNVKKPGKRVFAVNSVRLEYIATGMVECNIVPRKPQPWKPPSARWRKCGGGGGGVVKLPQSNEMSALIFQPSLVRRPTVDSMLITLIVSWRGLNIKISFSLDGETRTRRKTAWIQVDRVIETRRSSSIDSYWRILDWFCPKTF